jgi:uncharacterized protein YndB with AHSA1/START domain
MDAKNNPFIISRTVNAPRELVWDAYTKPEHLKRWFGPKGFTMPTCNMDFRPGGIFHYCMRSADGQEMWGKWTFHEIVRPEKLVTTTSFSDASGGVARHPMAPTWPLETMGTTTFTELDGKTTIRLEWTTVNATETEQKAFDASHASMNMGWSGTFEQLEAFLAEEMKGRG